jgi:hypothetical protein
MNAGAIIFIIVLLVVLYFLITYFSSNKSKLTDIQNAQNMTTINASTLSSNTSGTTSNFAYSVWFYIDDWNYRYGQTKVIFGRAEPSTSANSPNGLNPCPLVTLGPTENNVNVTVACFGNGITSGSSSGNDTPINVGRPPYGPGNPPPIVSGGGGTGTTTDPNATVIHNCRVTNVPVQKWVNLIISVYARTLDVYLDGKLVRTCLLPNTVKVNNQLPIYLTPNGGFSGYTSQLQYFSNSLNPEDAYNIYRKGYGQSIFSTGYKVQVSVSKNGMDAASFQV